jgi:hypothetical protein
MEFAASPTSDIELRHLELQIIVPGAQLGASTPGTNRSDALGIRVAENAKKPHRSR